MSSSRQSESPPSDADLIVRSLALKLPPGFRLDTHDHPWPQLLYATEGVLSFEHDAGAWIVPPLRAVWIPPGFEHAASTLGLTALRTLYFDPGLFDARCQATWASSCRVLHVRPLLREMILEIIRSGALDRRRSAQARLAEVALDQLETAEDAPVDLPLPRDPRARRLAERLRADPSNMAPLADLARDCGATPRTLERLFKKETSLSFGRWRRHARLTNALHRLAEGEAVTDVALASGYDSTSAFIAMFKRELGTTPGQFFRSGDRGRLRVKSASS